MRTKKALVFGLMGLAMGSGAVAACGSDSFVPDSDSGAPVNGDDAGGGGGSDASSDATIVGSGCDPKQVSGSNACPPSEGLGFFVVAGSDPTVADGTRNKPFASIQKGIDAGKAAPAKKFVYVCVGDFKESLTLANGISVYAGWGCAGGNWTPVEQHATLHATSSPAVVGDQIIIGTTVDSLDIFAPDGTKTSKSSVGAVFTKSTKLELSNCTIQAGNGFDGEDGVEGVVLTQSSAGNGANGDIGGLILNPLVADNTSVPSCPQFAGVPLPSHCNPNGANGGTTTCTAPSSPTLDVSMFQPGAGGRGGQGAQCTLSLTKSDGTACDNRGGPHAPAVCCSGTPDNGAPQPATTTTGVGGVFNPVTAAKGMAGVDGATGSNGTSGWNGTTWNVADGVAGGNGKPGLGGGGGAGANPFFIDDGTQSASGKIAQGGGGTGGGAGGCPGLAGTAGSGGGASVAIVLSESPIVISSCVVKAQNGGKAGKGTFGSAPTTGGSAGADTSYLGNVNLVGAKGGAGGNSGLSGNGSAGPSFGIVSHAGTPSLTDTSPQVGSGGAGVDARTQGTKTIPATPAGQALPTTSF